MALPVWLIAGLTSFGIAKLSGASTKNAIKSGILGGATAGIFGPGSQGSKDLVMAKSATDTAAKTNAMLQGAQAAGGTAMDVSKFTNLSNLGVGPTTVSLPEGFFGKGAVETYTSAAGGAPAFVAPNSTMRLPTISYDPLSGQVLGDSGSFMSSVGDAAVTGASTPTAYNPVFENLLKAGAEEQANPTLTNSVKDYFKNMSTPTKVGLGVSALTLAAQPKTPDKKPSLYESQEYKDLVTSERAKANKQIEGITTARTYTEEDDAMPDLYNYNNNMMYANQGGIVNIMPKYNEGGINYLPSKMEHDEKDVNNYVRASGYVEDGTGVGDKDEDTMLAQLADGEFVSRADAILGAGIMAGADPKDMKEMRKKGAAFFYSQQDSLKRVYDLIN
tara:strand:- start:1175 stop:2341 length:1167 start_codon:yes stop_codon:yes gene_type:complete